MSFENKGSMVATCKISREPDRSGNYICTGANDDVEIQRAVDDGWKEIYLGEGIFSISTVIVDNGNSNVTIRGAGKYATKLDLQSGITCFNITSVNGWTIRDLEIDGNDYQANQHYGIRFDNVDDGLIENVYVHNFAYIDTTGWEAWGILLNACERTDVVRCRVEECDHCGIMVQYDSMDCDVIDCKCKNNANGNSVDRSAHIVIFGSDGHECIRCNIVNCHGETSLNYSVEIYRWCLDCWIIGGHYKDSANQIVGIKENNNIGCGALGVTAEAVNDGGICFYTECDQAAFISCTARAEDGVGFVTGFHIANGVQRASIQGGIVRLGNTQRGIQLAGCDWCEVVGVSIWCDEVGIRLTSGSTYNQIMTCNIYSESSIGVQFQNGADNNTVHGCSIYSDAAPVDDTGGGAGNVDTDNRKVQF